MTCWRRSRAPSTACRRSATSAARACRSTAFFTIAGFGTVVTGTLIDGEFAAGAEIELMPGGGCAAASAGCRRIETAGARVARHAHRRQHHRHRQGRDPPRPVLAAPRTLAATGVVDVRLVAVAGLPHAVRHNMNVTFHCFADEANAQVRLLQPGDLRPGDSGWAQIKLGNGGGRGARRPLRLAHAQRHDRRRRHRRYRAEAPLPRRRRHDRRARGAALRLAERRRPRGGRAQAAHRSRNAHVRARVLGADVDTAPPNSSTRARSCCWAMALARALCCRTHSIACNQKRRPYWTRFIASIRCAPVCRWRSCGRGSASMRRRSSSSPACCAA